MLGMPRQIHPDGRAKAAFSSLCHQARWMFGVEQFDGRRLSQRRPGDRCICSLRDGGRLKAAISSPFHNGRAKAAVSSLLQTKTSEIRCDMSVSRSLWSSHQENLSRSENRRSSRGSRLERDAVRGSERDSTVAQRQQFRRRIPSTVQ